jgi:hypothetical protein
VKDDLSVQFGKAADAALTALWEPIAKTVPATPSEPSP